VIPFVVPADVADVNFASGGNIYDRRVSEIVDLRPVPAAGQWPTPDTASRVALDRALAEVPDGTVTLIDGLVACGVPSIVVPHARRLRLVVLLHMPLGDDPGLSNDRAAELDALERETLRASFAVVATSRWARRRLIGLHRLDARRVHVVEPGTDPAPLAGGSASAGSQLLCVAAVVPRKGQDVLVEALAGVADLPWKCELVGSVHRDPDFVDRVRDLIRRHGLVGRVTLAGAMPALPGAQLDGMFNESDLLVLPSRQETYGMVVTEALVRGIPVLTTTADGLPETLGQTSSGAVPGLLVPPGDVPALTEALRRWLTEPMLRERLREAARKRELDGWDVAGGRLATVLEGLRGESR
jgi:glycosyltransferase involved in cell wall biosynthesis